MCPLPFTLQPSGIYTVDYGDMTLWSVEESDYFNKKPDATRDRFPINKSGIKDVHFGLLFSNKEFTTGEAIEAASPEKNPDLEPITLADANAYIRKCPVEKLPLPLASFCGTIVDGYVAYLQLNGDGTNLFFNWMTFRRKPGTVILVAMRL